VGRHSNAETIDADSVENGAEDGAENSAVEGGPTDRSERRRIAMAVRTASPTPPLSGLGLDATTMSLRAASPALAPVAPPALHPVAPASRPGWRERRAARHELAAQVDLAARLSRAEHRSRMVSAFPVARPVSTRPTPPRP